MDDRDVPRHKGNQGILDYCHELGASGVRMHTVKFAVIDREIKPTRLGNANYFSDRDIEEWLLSRKQPVPTRFVGVHADRNPKNAAAVAK